jgi:ubiquinone/menaquinone biosynthesis C-methylase UbiE
LEQPLIYSLIQNIIGFYFHKKINTKLLEEIQIVTTANVPITILELACGTGNRRRLFDNLVSINFYGIDINFKYILYAHNKKGKITKARSKSRVYFLVSDATSLPIKTREVDIIFSVGFFHHLDELLVPQVISEIKRVKRVGGKIIIIEGIIPTSKWNLLGKILCFLDRGTVFKTMEQGRSIFENYIVIEKSYIGNGFPYGFFCFICS